MEMKLNPELNSSPNPKIVNNHNIPTSNIIPIPLDNQTTSLLKSPYYKEELSNTTQKRINEFPKGTKINTLDMVNMLLKEIRGLEVKRHPDNKYIESNTFKNKILKNVHRYKNEKKYESHTELQIAVQEIYLLDKAYQKKLFMKATSQEKVNTIAPGNEFPQNPKEVNINSKATILDTIVAPPNPKDDDNNSKATTLDPVTPPNPIEHNNVKLLNPDTDSPPNPDTDSPPNSNDGQINVALQLINLKTTIMDPVTPSNPTERDNDKQLNSVSDSSPNTPGNDSSTNQKEVTQPNPTKGNNDKLLNPDTFSPTNPNLEKSTMDPVTTQNPLEVDIIKKLNPGNDLPSNPKPKIYIRGPILPQNPTGIYELQDRDAETTTKPIQATNPNPIIRDNVKQKATSLDPVSAPNPVVHNNVKLLNPDDFAPPNPSEGNINQLNPDSKVVNNPVIPTAVTITTSCTNRTSTLLSSKEYREQLATKIIKVQKELPPGEKLNINNALNLTLKDIMAIEIKRHPNNAYIESKMFKNNLISNIMKNKGDSKYASSLAIQIIINEIYLLDKAYQKQQLNKDNNKKIILKIKPRDLIKPNQGEVAVSVLNDEEGNLQNEKGNQNNKKEIIILDPKIVSMPNPKVDTVPNPKAVTRGKIKKLKVCKDIDHTQLFNLVYESNSGYCKEGYRFFEVHCQGPRCNVKFVHNKTDEINTFRPTKRLPLYCCKNTKDECPYALCNKCYTDKQLNT